MKKVRINTSLRHKLETYVRSQIDAAIDKTPLEQAKGRLQQEALRLIAAAYPHEHMQILAAYGQTSRFSRFTFTLPDGVAESVEFDEDLAHDLPAHHGYRFETAIPADAAFADAVQAVANVGAALRTEARRQWEQASVLVGCALYFEDVLDDLRISGSERVSLSQRWHLPQPQAQAVESEDADRATLEDAEASEAAEDTASTGDAAPATDIPRLLIVVRGAVLAVDQANAA